MQHADDRPGRGQITTKRISDRGRRRFLRVLAGLGTLTAIGGCTSASNSSTVTYPELVSGGRVVRRITVPEDWDQHRIHVGRVYDRVRKGLNDIPGVVGTTLVRSPQVYGGHNGFQIKLIVESDALQAGLDIPEKIDGILTTTERSPERWGLANCAVNTDNCTNRKRSDTVGGGNVVGWVDGGYGTATCRVSVNGSQRLLHCGHVFWNGCADATSDDVTGRAAIAWGEPIGTVESINAHGDYSTINDTYGGDYAMFLDDNRTYPKLVGYVTKVACEYWNTLPRRSRPCLYNMGATTGLTTGAITKTGAAYTRPGCTNMENEGIQTDCNVGQGDSGGPTFLMYNGDAYLVNLTSYYYLGTHTACNGAIVGVDSAGIAAWWIANNTAISFKSG